MTSRWLPGAFAASALVAIALAAALTPSASAQTNTVTLAALGSSQKETLAGATVTFDFRVSNSDPLLPRDLTFRQTSGPSWNGTFDPATVKVQPGASANVAFKVPVKAATAPGSYAFTIEAVNTATTLPSGNTLNFTVLVQAPAPEPTNPDPPTLAIRLASASVHGLPGERVTNRIVLSVTNAGVDGVRVQARGQGPSYWPPGSVSLNGDWPVYEERSEAFTVLIPSDAIPGSLHSIRVSAESPAVPGGARTATFTVEVDAPVITDEPAKPTSPTPAPPTPAPEPEPASTPAPADDGTPDESETASYFSNVRLVLERTRLEVLPGQYVLSSVQVANTGSANAEITLGTTLPADFVVTFQDGGVIPLGPNSAREVRFSIWAPMGASALPETESTYLLTANGASEPFALAILKPAATVVGQDSAVVQESTAPAIAPPSTLDRLVAAYGLSAVLTAGVAAGAAGAGALTLAASPGARRHLVWVGIGLYTRLTRPKLLDHPEREKLFQTIESVPGIHFHALQRELAWNTGALTYHLRVLERHQLIVSRRDGILRRFYLVGQAPRTMPVATAPVTGAQVSLSGLRGNVLQTVRARGSIAQSALAEELGASKQTLNYHVKNLERLGLLRVERVGRDTFLSPSAEGGAAPAGAAQPPLAFVDGEFSRSDEYR